MRFPYPGLKASPEKVAQEATAGEFIGRIIAQPI